MIDSKARPSRSVSGQVAALIASLSFVPNLVLIVVTFGSQPERISGFWTAALAGWVIVLGGLSAAVGYWSAHLMLRPLTRLAQEVEYLESVLNDSERWTLSQHPQEPQEALILRRAISQLLYRLQLAQDQRAAFTATLMHDLKTPLVAFRHLLTVLQDNSSLTGEQRTDLLHQLLQENERILELVQRMTEVHRFEGEISLERHLCNLAVLARGLTSRLQPLATERKIALQVRGHGFAEVDPLELERALYNLMDNALRYARSQVEVEVKMQEIWVIDDGPGLPAPLESLAKPYMAERVEIAGKKFLARSTGLGLYIARRILEAHGGELQVIRTGSEGTTLALKLGLATRVADV